MPSVAQEQPPVASSKKRRRDDNLELYDTVLTSSGPIRPDQLLRSAYQVHEASGEVLLGAKSPDYTATKTIPHPLKRRRLPADDENSRPRSASPLPQYRPKGISATVSAREELQETSANSRPSPVRGNSAAMLSRCHICHRRPAKKSDLDSFADCQGCGQRTCYVCIRKCSGWEPLADDTSQGGPDDVDLLESANLSASITMEDVDVEEAQRTEREDSVACRPPGIDQQESASWARGGHREMVCSRCCIEKGFDGDVVCLGCLPYFEG